MLRFSVSIFKIVKLEANTNVSLNIRVIIQLRDYNIR